MPSMNLTWQIVVLVLAVLGGATFLGYTGHLSDQVVGGLYLGVISAVLVGHYSTRGGPGGGGP